MSLLSMTGFGEARDRRAELHALLGVLEGALQRGLGDPDALRRELKEGMERHVLEALE